MRIFAIKLAAAFAGIFGLAMILIAVFWPQAASAA